MRIKSLEPMVIREDLELEHQLEMARSNEEVKTEAVSPSDNKQSSGKGPSGQGHQNIIDLVKFIAQKQKAQKHKDHIKKNHRALVISKYKYLDQGEIAMASLGDSVDILL